MAELLIIVFILGYVIIALEGPLKIDRGSTALLTGVICWLVLSFGVSEMPAFLHGVNAEVATNSNVSQALSEHLGKISEILFFLLGAMTIVEIVDTHGGFRVITDRVTTSSRIKFLWFICWISFFLSSVLDNMTTSIIMCALVGKIIKKQNDIWLFGGFIVISANAGGAWSPIGDVTTIMLWIGGQVTSLNIIKSTFLASVTCLLLPLFIVSHFMRREKDVLEQFSESELKTDQKTTPFEQRLVFFLGGASLLFVPVFKGLTHLPPYMGILLSVGVLWYVTELLHRKKSPHHRHQFSVAQILHRIDTPSILFFLGILLAVASLDTSGHLRLIAESLNENIGSIYFTNAFIGLLSAIVDNVPLVAASMGMYELTEFAPDHDFWNLLAYCAGTGGSILIIGSAAGIATMGILKIDFLWYLKRISLYALIGYLAGIGVYYLQHG